MTEAINKAVDFLREQLAAGPITSEEIRTRADAAGVTWATMRRASLCPGLPPGHRQGRRERKGVSGQDRSIAGRASRDFGGLD
jgi:hypothetical protein